MNGKKDKICGSLIGGAIGDALGYQIEFKRNIKDKEITSFKDGKGIISDDTQMTLFTANALLYRKKVLCQIVLVDNNLIQGIDNMKDDFYHPFIVLETKNILAMK